MSNIQLSEVFKLSEEEKLVLPDFQRDFKWNRDKQTSLLASVMLQFPVGSILVLNGKKGDFAFRKLGDIDQHVSSGDEDCVYLLDGQQRISTLFYIFTDQFSRAKFESEELFKQSLTTVYSKLKKRWFLRLPQFDGDDENQPADIFGYKDLEFKESEISNLEPDEIMDCFESFSFNESNKQVGSWWSPFFEFRATNRRSFMAAFRDGCLTEKLIPLFYCKSDDKSLLHAAISSLAVYQAGKLQLETSDDLEKVLNALREFDYEGVTDSLQTVNDIRDNHNDLRVIWERKASRWAEEVGAYLLKLAGGYEVPSIWTSDVSRAIPIFRHLNEGGIRLGDYDLVVAKAAKKLEKTDPAYSLGSEIRQVIDQPLQLPPALLQNLPNGIDAPEYFWPSNFEITEDLIPNSTFQSLILSLLSLISKVPYGSLLDNEGNFRINASHTKSKEILSLSTEQIRSNVDNVVKALCRTFAFLNIRCGVCSLSDLHYRLMALPIAYVFFDDSLWSNSSVHDKVEYWYWSSIFSGSYLFDQNKRSINDLVYLFRWVSAEIPNPFKSREINVLEEDRFSSKNLLTFRIDGELPSKAIRVAIMQYTLSKLPLDFLFDQNSRILPWCVSGTSEHPDVVESFELEDHHVFPLAQAKDIGQSSAELRKRADHPLNSPLNRTYISKTANRIISSAATGDYLPLIGETGGVNVICKSHLLPRVENYQGNEKTDEYYLSLLDKRFEELDSALKAELHELIEGKD
ncbi:GmrSD restriction endonuclease domain-containing protein [Marinobacter sp. VGCF2001]|uniref:DUF262 domain-containing protein n=1 Tax=Marinobacter sp. VGCF2001 TaxID=3417189 RepID=UPI003CF537C6